MRVWEEGDDKPCSEYLFFLCHLEQDALEESDPSSTTSSLRMWEGKLQGKQARDKSSKGKMSDLVSPLVPKPFIIEYVFQC